MSILSIVTDVAGQINVNPRRVKIISTDSLATVTTAGYLNSQSLTGISILPTDVIDMIYLYNTTTGAGTYDVFLPSISSLGVITLSVDVNAGNVLLPVVSGHIATFNGTSGQIADLTTPAVHLGNIVAGASGTAGVLTSFPSTATTGSLSLTAVASSGNFAGVISNASLGQASTWSLPDPANAAARVLVGATATPFVSGNFPVASGTGGLMVDSGVAAAKLDSSLSSATAATNKVFVKTITATAAALATSGHVTVMANPSATSQFKILNIRVMYAAAGLSGGGGDRLLTLTDGTIVFNQAGITAAVLGTPVYTLWGGTGNPLPGAVSTISTAGADIYLVYSGGTTDYTTGQIVIEVELAQVTA